MELPKDYDKLKFPIFSNNPEIDVLYLHGVFNLTVENMMQLFMCSHQDIADVINKKFSDNALQNSISRITKHLSDGSSTYDNYFDLYAILEIGSIINPEETKHFSDWAHTLLPMYMMQKQVDSGIKGIHSSAIDFWDEYNTNMATDPEDGIQMNELISYLKEVNSSYTGFIDKLIDIEETGCITKSDIGYLNSVELCYYDRKLHKSAFKEFGNDIEEKIYLAILSDLRSKLQDYMGDWNVTPWSEKIDSLKVEVIKIGVECKLMFYLIERYSYFCQRLVLNYESIVHPEYKKLFELKFNFWDLCAEKDLESDINEKRRILVEGRIEATQWMIEECSTDEEKIQCEEYIDRCQQSIDLIDYEISQKSQSVELLKTNASPKGTESNSIKLASKRKTDFIKLLSAMYDTNTFESANPAYPLTKENVLEAFGVFLNEDLQAAIGIEESLTPAKIEDTSKISTGQFKSFPEYLLHEDKIRLAEAIRVDFSTIKGKSVRLLLNAMETFDPPLISFRSRQGKEIYKSMFQYFNGSIGAYQSTLAYAIAPTDQQDIESMKVCLNHILKEMKKDRIA